MNYEMPKIVKGETLSPEEIQAQELEKEFNELDNRAPKTAEELAQELEQAIKDLKNPESL